MMRKLLASVTILIFLMGCSTAKDYPVINLQQSGYRRFPYKTEGNHRKIEIFYATSRKTEKKDGELYFTSALGKAVTVGTLEAKIDPRLKIGKMLPKRMKRKGIIGVQNVSDLNRSVFMEKLSESVAKSPQRSLLVLVHGFKDNFEMTATKLVYFSYLLDVDTPVLMFDWPGDQPVTPRGYRKSEKLASASGPYLGKLLTDIIREVKPEKLWIGSASLGCQVVSDAFEWMYHQPDLADAESEIAHVLMSAPDVGKEEFDLKFKDEISALAKQLTVYVSSDDKALLVARILARKKKFGRQAIKPEENAQYDEAENLLDLKAIDPGRISIIDVTAINHASFHHGYDLESPEYYDDFFMRVLEVPPEKNRRLYLVRAEDNMDYWIMRADG